MGQLFDASGPTQNIIQAGQKDPDAMKEGN
jgi:hypothetical protein